MTHNKDPPSRQPAHPINHTETTMHNKDPPSS